VKKVRKTGKWRLSNGFNNETAAARISMHTSWWCFKSIKKQFSKISISWWNWRND